MSSTSDTAGASHLRISADSHMGEPPDLWEKGLPGKYRDKALKFKDVLFETNHHLRAGCWEPNARLKDIAVDGIAAEVLYPTNGVQIWRIEDKELQEAHIRVYNDWMIDFCAVAPERFWGLGMVSLWNIDNAIAEMRRFVDAGLHGVDIWIAPPAELPYSNERYEPFWAAAEEVGVPLSMHIGGRTEAFGPDSGLRTLHSVNGHKFDAMNSLLHLIGGGVLERHPGLNIVIAEVGVGWMPFWIQELDYYTTGRSPLPMLPSEYFKRQVYGAFISDLVGTYLLAEYGQSNFMWSNDYPHPASIWPESHVVIPDNLGHLPQDVQDNVIWRTAAKVYNRGQLPPPADPPVDRDEVEQWMKSHKGFGSTSRLRHAVQGAR